MYQSWGDNYGSCLEVSSESWERKEDVIRMTCTQVQARSLGSIGTDWGPKKPNPTVLPLFTYGFQLERGLDVQESTKKINWSIEESKGKW